MKFRKKPVVIEATQWFKNGDHPAVRIDHHAIKELGDRSCNTCGKLIGDHGYVSTLEGGHLVCVGDWIITGVKGEHYPCKPGVFKVTYEAAE